MLEGFSSFHPPAWTSRDLVPSSATTEEEGDQKGFQLQSAKDQPNGKLNSLRGRSYSSVAEQTRSNNLFVSLDFLHEAEDRAAAAAASSTSRGRLGPGQGKPPRDHRQSQGSAFYESPDLDSPIGSEQEWRRSIASNGDPVYKTGHRSSSREPPGSTRLASSSSQQVLPSSLSPCNDSSPPGSISSIGQRQELPSGIDQGSALTRDRSSSTSRLPQHPLHLAPRTAEFGSPLRQTVEFAEQERNGAIAARRSSAQPISSSYNSRSTNSNGTDSSSDNSTIPQRSMANSTSSSIAISSHMSSSPGGKSRPGMASSPTHLATMHEEAFDFNDTLRNNGDSNGFRNSARHRSTSSAAALQHIDRSASQRGNSADTFSRSISLWKGEFGGMSPGTYSRAAALQQQQSHQQQQQQQQQDFKAPQWERGRRNEYIGGAFDVALSEEDDARELGGVGNGSESRRHSIAAESAGNTLMGPRRAVGFEVGRPHASSAASRTNSVGRSATVSSSFAGSGLFGGGGLAISDDDLAADLHSLHLNLDDMAAHRQQHQQHHQQQHQHQQEERRRMDMRIPSTNAAMTGVHAASMPSGFGAHNVSDFGQSPPLGVNRKGGNWPTSTGFQDEETTSWSDMIPSPATTNSGFTDSTHGYQYKPTRLDRGREQPPLVDERKNGLSATAKAFHGTSFGQGALPSPQVGQSYAQGAFAPSYPARQSSQERSSPPSNPFKPFDRQAASQQQQQQHLSSPPSNVATLSDMAIASLVTLGPLAPASGGPSDGPGNLQELGKGVPLQMLPRSTVLYIVEFKEGRTDLYFRQQQGAHEEIRKGDLVIVEADRGKDLGTVINDTITVDQVQTFLSHQAELAQSNGTTGDVPHPAALVLNRLTRSINPKRLFSKAGPADTSLLHSKGQDEERALTLCTTKVNQRGLPMTVVAAEMQWDRRKLTFYYTATQRVDFRDLVKELFRLYKTRIWMCHLSHPSGTGIST